MWDATFRSRKPQGPWPYDDALVVVGEIVMTLGSALERAPARKLQYHLLEPDPQPGAPGHFQLTVKNTVVYRCLELPAVRLEPDAAEEHQPNLGLSQAHAASALSPKEWKTRLTDIIWTVRHHAAKGLQPVRPHVILKGVVTLKAGTSVKLSI